MQISNFISKMLELLENKETAGTTSSNAKKSNKLFSVDYSNENLKYLEDSSLSYEKLEELALKEELKALSSQMTVELTKMMASGKITPEKYEEIEEVLSSGVNSENIIELQKMVSELEEPKTQETFDNAEDIEEKLGELGEKTRESVMKKVGDINSIKSLEVLDNGSFKILTTDDSSILTSESGKIIQTYDNEYKTGFDVYDEQDRLKSSTYVDHKKDDVTVVEKYEHNDDGSYKETIDSTADPKTQKIVSVDENSNITNVEIKNKETGEVTQDEEFSQTLNQNPSSDGAMVTGGASDVGGPTNDDIAADEAQLAQLQQEQTQTQQDLTCQQATYDQTNAQKEQEVGALDSQIATEQTNLDSATQEQTAAQGEVDEATGVCEQAQAGVDSAQGEVDSTQATLDDATNTANQAQCAQQTAASNQAAAVSEEQAAQADSTAANNDLSAATDATNAASCEKQATASDLNCAVGKTNAAFNVKTQRDQDVKDKEREYKEAEAQKNKKKKNVIDYLCDAWNWVCEQCSKAWNALTNAKDKQKEAQEDYKNKKTDEDKKRVIDEEAQRELEKRQDEQDTAKSVADAAQVVLDAKTGAREVSDQELADALLDLADAMMAQEGAVTEHDGALNAFMEAQGYKADADGNLVDKQGNLVSCQEIVQGLETFVGELSTQKTTTEASYNQVLETTTAVIQGDEQKIQQLGTEIQTLQQDITQKKAELALQEEMLTQLTSERSDMNAYDTKEAEDKYWSDRQKLEQAIMSGDPKALEEAYKALYGDKEVVVDASGKVVDPATLSEEERAKCTTKKVSELGASDLTNKVAMDTVAAGESAQMAELLADGAFAVNGQPVSQEELNEALIKQAEEQIAELERTMDAQGLFSKGVGGLNNVLGIGTTGEDAKFEVQRYKELVEQLKTCKNPTQYAALYKQVTGNNFSAGEVVELCAYRQANNMPASPTTSKAPQVPAGNKIDLGEHVNSVVEACKGEDGKVNTNALRKTGNSKGAEAINDYKETQQSIVEGAKGVLVGLAAVAAVAASPFTGGGSLALLGAVCVGAAAGAGASIAIGMADSIYDADGNGSWDFNYTLDDLKGDAITGAITGGVSGLTMGVGDKVCGAVTSKASTAIATSGKEAFKQTVTKVGGKVFGEAVEGFIDGSVSAAADYTYRTAGTGEFSVTDMFKAAGQGGTMGAVVGGGMGGAGELFSGAKHLIDGKIMKGKVDDILTMGGMKEVIDLDDGTSVINYKANPNAGTDLIPTNGLAEIPDLKLEDVIANNLDPKYITDGKVNKWAINQITQDAKGAQKALQKAGLGENTLNVLNNISTDNYANVADVTALLTNKNNMAKLGLEGVDGKIDADKASNFLSGLDEVKTRANGSIEEITSYAPNGQKVSLQFDEKGSIADVKIVQDTPVDDGVKVASDVAPDVDSTSTTTAASDVDYKDDYVVMSDGDVIMPDGSVKSGADIESGPKADVEAGTKTTANADADVKTNTASRPETDKYIDPSNPNSMQKGVENPTNAANPASKPDAANSIADNATVKKAPLQAKVDPEYVKFIESKTGKPATYNDIVKYGGKKTPLAKKITPEAQSYLDDLAKTNPEKYQMVSQVIANTNLMTKTANGVSDDYVTNFVKQLTEVDDTLLKNVVDNNIPVNIYDDLVFYNPKKAAHAQYSQTIGEPSVKELKFAEKNNAGPITINGVPQNTYDSIPHEFSHAFDYNDGKKLGLTQQDSISVIDGQTFERFAQMPSFSKEFDDAITADIIRMSEIDELMGREYGATFNELLNDPDFKYYFGAGQASDTGAFSDIITRKELFAQMSSYVTSGKVTNAAFQDRIEELFPNMLDFTKKTLKGADNVNIPYRSTLPKVGFDGVKAPMDIKKLADDIRDGNITTYKQAIDAGYSAADIYKSGRALEIIDVHDSGQLAEYFNLKMYDKMQIKTPQDVDNLVHDIMQKANCTEAQALEAVKKMTQFSSFSQIENLGKALSDVNIGNLIDTGSGTSTNKALQYLSGSKGQFNIHGSMNGLILDESGLDWLRKQDIAGYNPADGTIMCKKINELNGSEYFEEVKLIAVDGWNIKNANGQYDSISFLGSSVSSDEMSDFIARQITNGTTDSITKEATDIIGAKLGVVVPDNITVIKNPSFEATGVSATTISDAMKPVMSQEYTQAFFEIYPSYFATDKHFITNPQSLNDAMEALAHYFDDTVSYISPETTSKMLKTIYEGGGANYPGITQYLNKLADQGKLPKGADGKFDMHNVVYVIPEEGKSFDLVTQQFITVNHIGSNQVVTWDGTMINLPSGLNLDGKAVVVLDDIVGSGDSMLKQKFKMGEFDQNFHDIPLVVAPLSTLKQGFDNINSTMANFTRDGKVIYGTKVEVKNAYKNNTDLNLIMGATGYTDGYAATYPQYMLPDNNSAVSSLFGYKNVVNPTSIKDSYGTNTYYGWKKIFYGEYPYGFANPSPDSLCGRMLARAKELEMTK